MRQDQLGGSRGAVECFSRAGLAEGTGANTIQILAPNGAGIDFAIEGIAYHKADTDNIALTPAPQQPALTTCLYLIQVDSAGVVSSIKGDDVLNADLDAGKTVLHWPLPAANRCPIGALRVRCNNAATFTAGSTDLGAADVVDVFYNFAGGMPAVPLAS